MHKKFFLKNNILLIFLISALVNVANAQTYEKQLADGVILKQQIEVQTNNIKSQIINILEIDQNNPNVKLKAIISQDKVYAADSVKGRETISSLAKRYDAIAAINADFFPFTGDMLNLHITDGELISEPMPNRTVFGITDKGKFLFNTLGFNAKLSLIDGRSINVNGLNRPRGKNEIIAYTSKYSSSTMTSNSDIEVLIKIDRKISANTKINGIIEEINISANNSPLKDGYLVLSGAGMCSMPLKKWLQPGTQVSLEFNIIASDNAGWKNIKEAVGGGPRLIRNGRISVEYDNEKLGASFSNTLHPRSAIGVTSDNKVILVTVDGRQSISSGISLKKLAEILLGYKCVDAMNLDGGGSTTLATSSGLLNSPSEGIERSVANAIAIFSEKDIINTDGLRISNISQPIVSGTSYQFLLVDPSGIPVDRSISDKIIWTTYGGIGFIDQSGKFYGLKARNGFVRARIGAGIFETPVEVIPGTPKNFSAKIENDPNGAPNRGKVKVALTDLNNNIIDGIVVHIKTINGIADQEFIVTNKRSENEIWITWDDVKQKNGIVTLSINGLNSIKLYQPSK